MVARFYVAAREMGLTLNGSSATSRASGGSSGAAAELERFPVGTCPAEQQLGVRPALHNAAPDLFGGRCEPWAGRRAVTLLQALLAPDMAGLEWGAGASTLWYLNRCVGLAGLAPAVAQCASLHARGGIRPTQHQAWKLREQRESIDPAPALAPPHSAAGWAGW